MRNFLSQISVFLDKQDKKAFFIYILALLFSGVITIIGIGTVIPLIIVLIDPEKVSRYLPVGFGIKNTVSVCVFLMIFAFIVKNIVSFALMCVQSKFQTNISAKIRNKLFRNYLHSPMIYHKNNSSLSMINSVSYQIQNLTNSVILPFGVLITESLVSGIMLLILLFINPWLVIFLAASFALIIGSLISVVRVKSKIFGNLRADNLAELNLVATNALGSIKETKLYAQESNFISNFENLSAKLQRMETLSLNIQQSSRFIIETVAVTIMLLLIYFLILLNKSSHELLLILAVFSLLSSQLLPSLNRLMMAVSRIQMSLPLLNQVYSSFMEVQNVDLPPALSSNQKALKFEKELELRNIAFSYAEQNILQSISLTIPRGAKVALVGKSGAGKSTLIDVLMCLLPYSTGQILLDGVPIEADNIPAYQKLFAYVPQSIYLYDDSILKNIACYDSATEVNEDQVWLALRFAGLEEFVKNSPDGLETSVGQNGQKLSGGQQRRIGIARAVYLNPAILVMDEPTNGLDSLVEAQIMRELLSKDITVLCITHKLEILSNFNLVYNIELGRINRSS
ncbi:MAG: ATP-binding cassette, subfamily bacterial PglK [Pseudomonadota bacterium]|jgi:ABC-type multidrug transport system fused ATPase/permease subunit|nr:ABC transporter ATP-binding protein [Burkholderiales bacterium]MDQ5921904.1 ATP-binding cassette, subfamily bacterial PglK [Pseudomonadota bacterium]